MFRLILCCVILNTQLFAQKTFYPKHPIPIYFYDYQYRQYSIIDDSTGIYRFDKKDKSWKFFAIKLNLEEPFVDFIRKYTPLSDRSGKTYFVDKGCGIVYELSNDSIHRIDKSNHHQNQYFGAFFLHGGKPTIFGGYGLFQFKNITTQFNLIDREWYCIPIETNLPRERTKCLYQFSNNKLYIAGGFSGSNQKPFQLNDAWMLNLLTKKWLKLGTYDTTIFKHTIFYTEFYSEYKFDQNYIYDISTDLKQVNFFLNPLSTSLKAMLRNEEQVLIYKQNSREGQPEIYVIDEDVIFDKPVRTIPFLTSDKVTSDSLLAIGIPFFILFVLFVIFFFFKRKRVSFIHSMKPLERSVYDLFMKNYPAPIEIISINDLINSDNPSMDALKKRRESLLKEFKQSISLYLNLPFDEVLLENKLDTDRRIKLLEINKKAANYYLKVIKRK